MVPVNWHWTGEELAYVLDDSGSKALFVDDRYLDIAADAVGRLDDRCSCCRSSIGDATAPDGFTDYDELLAASSADEPADQTLGGPMFYTSGTTGFPKGVRTSTIQPGMPANLMELVAAGLVAQPVDPRRRHVVAVRPALPLGPVGVVAAAAARRVSRCVMQHKFDPAEVLELIDTHDVTNVHLVPTQFIRLLKLDRRPRARRSTARRSACVWHGAAPCPPQVKRDMIDWFGPKVWEYYGGTEGGIISVISAEEWLERPGSVGKLLPSYEVQILDDDGDERAHRASRARSGSRT